MQLFLKKKRACGLIGVLSNEGDAEMSCLKGLEKMTKSYCAGFLKICAFFF